MRTMRSRAGDDGETLYDAVQRGKTGGANPLPRRGPLSGDAPVEVRAPPGPEAVDAHLPAVVFDPPTRVVGDGATVEGLARDHYGEDWRAGVGAIMAGNGLRTNRYGSPVLAVGREVRLPSLGEYDDQQRQRMGPPTPGS